MKKLALGLAVTLFSLQLTAQNNCNADFQYTLGLCPTVLFFSNLADTVTPNSYILWDFGDGTVSDDPHPEHFYGANGTYEVCLTVEQFGCTASHCEVIVVDCHPDPPVCEAFFQYSDADCPTIEFFGATTTPPPGSEEEWFWEFGDGTTGFGPNPVHTYEHNGVYNVCLITYNSAGCAADYCDEVVVDCILPDCNAYFNYTVGDCPTVHFYGANSTGGIDGEYLWYFGDGTVGEGVNAMHTYAENGIYNACLVVMTPDGCTAEYCEEIFIGCILDECEAFFEYTAGDCPSVQFYGYTNTIANPVSWYWEFGDGHTSTLQNPLHTYEENGWYSACLVIATADGCTATFCQDIYVDCNQLCETYFEYSYGIVCPLVSFWAAPAGSADAEYTWHFGDGTVGEGYQVVHEYPQDGIYTVCLVATYPNGCVAEYCEEIFIACNVPCEAWFEYSMDCPYVQFNGHSSEPGNPGTVNWYWDFGDGGDALGPNPAHSYNANGTYTVCVTYVCSNGVAVDYCEEIVIDCIPPNCEAWFEYSQQDCPTVEFWANDVNIPPTDPIIWTWYFGDGTMGYGQNPAHTYEYNGVYTVCLVVTTPDGCTAEFCNEIYIECVPRPCHAFFDYQLDCPAAYFYVVLPPDVAPGTEYIWDFGDGTTGYGWEPIHVYEENGSYEVCLTTICEDGSVEEYCSEVVINCIPTDCQAWFDYSLEGCPTVEFYTTSAGTPVDGYNYYWDFGDGTTGTGANPEHTYCSNGTYEVCLIVITDDGCVATHCDAITIDCIAPACSANFEYSVTDDCPAVQFYWAGPDPTPNDLTEWQWIFGDGSTGYGPNPVHIYEEQGVYNVCLVVTTADGCTAAHCEQVIVECEPSWCEAYFEYELDDCPTVQFYGLNSTDPVPTPNNYWHWDFGDGTTGYGPNPEHTYADNGIYIVCLTIECDNGVAATYCEEIWIDCQPGYCDAFFEYSTEDCPEVQFYSVHPEPSGADDFQWFWDFGDGNQGEGPSPSHVYAANGIYTVCLIMICDNGIATTYCEEVIVDCGPPNCEAYFQYTQEDCSTVQYFSSSTSPPGTDSYWHWEFGDGSTSDEPNPVHSYDDNGVYTVCLTVVTPDGCTAAWCDQVLIDCDNNECEAIFDFSRQDCPDVAFFAGINTPTGNGEYHWDFGDGSTGYGPIPVHTYTQNGSYDVCLTVTTPWGCTATHCEEVRINCLRHGLQSWISTVRAFPNPSSDRVVIEFEEEREGVSWSLSGMDGNEYERRAVGNSDGFELDLNGLTKGMYFLEIKAGEDSGTIKLFKY